MLVCVCVCVCVCVSWQWVEPIKKGMSHVVLTVDHPVIPDDPLGCISSQPLYLTLSFSTYNSYVAGYICTCYTVWQKYVDTPAHLHLCTEYSYFLDSSILPTIWQKFGEGPFLFQYENVPVHKARSMQKWFSEFGVEELHWLAQSPDLNPIQHLWDELEPRLWPLSTSMSQNVVESLKPEEWMLPQQHINAHGFGMRCSTMEKEK